MCSHDKISQPHILSSCCSSFSWIRPERFKFLCFCSGVICDAVPASFLSPVFLPLIALAAKTFHRESTYGSLRICTALESVFHISWVVIIHSTSVVYCFCALNTLLCWFSVHFLLPERRIVIHTICSVPKCRHSSKRSLSFHGQQQRSNLMLNNISCWASIIKELLLLL